jgi:Sulfatase
VTAEAPRPAGRRGVLVAWLHLGVLWGFAVAQPLFGVLSDSPEFFVARDNTTGDIVLLAFVLVLVPPTVMALVELALSRLPRAQRALHLALVWFLLCVLAIQAIKGIADKSAVFLVPAAAIAGTAGMLAYARWAPARSLLTVLSPAPLLFLASFLLISPVSKLVLPQDDATAEASVKTGVPIVMVVFDEFADTALLDARHRVDRKRYPNFGALAAGSTWYRNAASVADMTPRAVPSILTGIRPGEHPIPIASEMPHNLFTLFGRDHAMNVEEPVTALCPDDLCRRVRDSTGERLSSLASDLWVIGLHRVAPRDVESHLPVVSQGFGGFGNKAAAVKAADGDVAFSTVQNREAAFRRFLGGIDGHTTEPQLNFLHSTVPHVPWEFLPSGQQYVVNGPETPGLADEVWDDDPELVEQAEQRYLLQVGYADRLLGRLFQRLRDAGLYDRSLIVVTADHGVSFRPGEPRRTFTNTTAGEIAPVPLFIKAPGQQRGRVDESRIRTVDVLPTMTRILEVKLPWKTDPPIDDLEMNGVHVSYADFDRLREEALRRELKLFPATDVFDFGIRGATRGGGSSDTAVELDERFDDVDPNGPIVPAYVSGRLSDNRYDRVAIVVNGTVRGTAPTFSESGQIRFAGMIPPSSLRRSGNRVAVYGVDGSRLVALRQEGGETYRLADGRLTTSGGREIPVDPSTIRGFVEQSFYERGRLRITGWSTNQDQPAERIVLFADGKFLASTRPSVKRLDIAKEYGDGATLSGYQLGAAVGRKPEDVQVFAVLDGKASRLPALKG